MFRHVHAILLLLLAGFFWPGRAAEPAFAQRGYYMTFMRMPTFGLAEWLGIGEQKLTRWKKHRIRLVPR